MFPPIRVLRDRPLQQQLYKHVRDLILSSRLVTGMRMPSTRMLAEQCGVSRITVLLTYERLIAEGYLRTISAKGTFVHGAVINGRAPFAPDAAAEAAACPSPCSVGRPAGQL